MTIENTTIDSEYTYNRLDNHTIITKDNNIVVVDPLYSDVMFNVVEEIQYLRYRTNGWDEGNASDFTAPLYEFADDNRYAIVSSPDGTIARAYDTDRGSEIHPSAWGVVTEQLGAVWMSLGLTLRELRARDEQMTRDEALHN